MHLPIDHGSSMVLEVSDPGMVGREWGLPWSLRGTGDSSVVCRSLGCGQERVSVIFVSPVCHMDGKNE